MASKALVPHKARGETVVVPGKQRKVEGRSKRPPLNDIGNVVTVRGAPEVKQQIARPVTRSFGAKLLANAQSKVSENIKKAEGKQPQNQNPAAQKPPAKKKAICKAKAEDVIVISSDASKEVKQKGVRKRIPTMTSILAARSQAACGMAGKKKLKDPVIDIDAADVENELAVVEYVDEMYKFYKLIEGETQVPDYMKLQIDINENMRAILIDWLIDVHLKFELMPETLYLTVNVLDRFLAVKMVPRRELQLVGIGAMLIACKYEEIWAPEVNDFLCISEKLYSNEQILKMEKAILGDLEWCLTVPTPYIFLVRFIKAAIPDKETENMVYFLSELALMEYAAALFCPSVIAAAAVYAARRTLNKSPFWTETLAFHTGLKEPELMECAKMLAGLHSRAAGNKQQVVHRKYSEAERGGVAQLLPAKALLASGSGDGA